MPGSRTLTAGWRDEMHRGSTLSTDWQYGCPVWTDVVYRENENNFCYCIVIIGQMQTLMCWRIASTFE